MYGRIFIYSAIYHSIIKDIMKAKKLIEMLEQLDPDAEIISDVGSEIGSKKCKIIGVSHNDDDPGKSDFATVNIDFGPNMDWDPWDMEKN
jgi:hypothetical protein